MVNARPKDYVVGAEILAASLTATGIGLVFLGTCREAFGRTLEN